MATHNIHGAELTNPSFKIRGYGVVLDENENKESFNVDVLFFDNLGNDAPVVLNALDSEIPIPSTTQLPAIKAWVNTKLQEFQI